MQLNEDTRYTVKLTNLISKMSFENIKMFYGSFLTVFFMNQIEERETHIPYFGSIYLDTKTMELSFKSDKGLVKIFNQYQKGEITDIQKFFMKQIESELEKIVGEE